MRARQISVIEGGIKYNISYLNGYEIWKLNGIVHREMGPAIGCDSYTSWVFNGKMHRENGPAIEYSNGTKFWYLNGKKLNITNDDQFIRLMKLKAFL